MKAPDTIVIDGRAYSWRALCEQRRQQLEAWKAAQPGQPVLFELKNDSRRRRNAPRLGATANPHCSLLRDPPE